MLKPTPGEQARDDALRPWLVRSSSLIANRLRDARAHAEAGRAADAASRLDELATALAEDILGPAREQFYLQAFRDHRLELDPSIVDQSVAPNRSGAFAARRAPILGRDQVQELRWLLDGAWQDLQLAAVATYADPGVRPAVHETWEIRHRGRLKTATTAALSDAQTALHHAIGRLLIRPELR
jgi:hypothetical protein